MGTAFSNREGVMGTVLIVEDEDQVRVLAESYLREQGHQTVSAATPEEAAALARSQTEFWQKTLAGMGIKPE